jgi:hypothetical protein
MRQLRIFLFIIFSFLMLSTAPGFASSLNVTWSANNETDLAGYQVYYGLQSKTYGTLVDVGKATGYQITNVQSGSTYYIAVTAYDTSGNESAKSSEISKYISAQTQQSVITLLSPVNGSTVSTSPTFKWSGQGYSKYSVLISINNGRSWFTIYNGSSTSCGMTATWGFLRSGTTILWYVKGVTTTGQTAKSSILKFIKK